MKYTIIVDKNREEEAIIYTHKRTEFIDDLEILLSKSNSQIIGFNDCEIVPLDENEIFCITIENNKVYAVLEKEKYLLKERLYKIEEMLGGNFIRINQSCIANIKKIKKFDSSISGSLKVVFKNGHIDYVSRRNVRNIKERLGV